MVEEQVQRVRRDGGVLLEAVIAVALFAVLAVPLLQSFQVGVRQTKVVKDRLIGRAIASWALAGARSFARSGAWSAGTDPLTADALAAFPGVGPQLPELDVSQTISEIEPGLLLIQVLVSWRPPQKPQPTTIELSGLERPRL